MLSFFQSSEWANVLNAGFNARTLSYIVDNVPLQFTLFRYGPLCLAYAAFPVGFSNNNMVHSALSPDLLKLLKSRGALALRYTSNYLEHSAHSGDIILPDTIIMNLQNWTIDSLRSDVRYELRRSQREGLISRQASVSDTDAIFSQYSNIVGYHGGKARYTHSYFKALIALSETDKRVYAKVAETPNGNVCGFIIVINDGMTSYYLHGGHDKLYSHLRPGYALMGDAINSSLDYGAEEFNMMASPANQPELVKFKEKWGGVTSMRITRTVAFGNMGLFMLKLLSMSTHLNLFNRH